jgi:transketolase
VPSQLTPELDQAAVNIARGFAMDAPLKAKSGHQGTAMALAPLAHVLYSRVMKHDPTDAMWPDRDRFVLSAGHASILQYSMLFLQGYGLELSDIQDFRQWNSATPGHPERGHTAGIEVTTGPLGQGFANAVGLALAERHLRARFGSELTDHHTYVIAGDGCLMEGVSHEAASLAGHQKLGRLIVVFDDNQITIDGSTNLTCSDDVAMRFSSYGWEVVQLGAIGEDLNALESALVAARDSQDDRPKLLILRTQVGFPSPDWTGKHEAHGNPFTAEHVSRAKNAMGMPDESFWAPQDVVDSFRSTAKSHGSSQSAAWKSRLASSAHKTEWDAAWNGGLADLVSGSADLTGNTGTKLSGQSPMSHATPEGRQIYYGIREHAMGSAMVGLALHGGVYPAGGTFFVFFDYMKPPIRLAALSRAKCLFVFSHDSVGVGEDGPTHQPIEHLAALRAIPDLQVIRPGDANETAQAIRAAYEFDGPTAVVLSRQNLPVVTDGSAVATGAGIVHAVDGTPDAVIVATGSEVHLAVAAAQELGQAGHKVQAVSLPSWDRFTAYRQQHPDLAERILPNSVPTVSVEAGTTFGWERFADVCIGIDRFGASAPGAEVLDRLGISVAKIKNSVLGLIAPR